jgi:hypothetical protein
MAKNNDKVFIQNGDERIELTGVELEAFEADRKIIRDNELLLEAEQAAKQEARTSALTKLATIAGLNEEEMTALGL